MHMIYRYFLELAHAFLFLFVHILICFDVDDLYPI